MKNFKLDMGPARSFSCQLQAACCRLSLGARGTKIKRQEKKMQRKTKRILVAILLVTFLVAAGIGTALAQEPMKININKASVDELCALKRIGPSYAQRIVEYREQNGPFEKPEDIMKVKGIGLKTFEANKDMIICQ
jgi:competence protein ComEA